MIRFLKAENGPRLCYGVAAYCAKSAERTFCQNPRVFFICSSIKVHRNLLDLPIVVCMLCVVQVEF